MRLTPAGELDLAVVPDTDPDPPADVELEHLMDDPFFVALPREHPTRRSTASPATRLLAR